MKRALVTVFLVAATAASISIVSTSRTTAAVSLYNTTEIRYCGPPVRDASGNIVRSSAVLSAFQKAHPCPVTGLTSGACPGWSKDHVIPLACGGCDAVFNMQWLPNEFKTTTSPYAKDRFERNIYSHYPDPVADTPACTFHAQPAP